MRALLGFILGVVVTIGGAYMYDASTGRASNGLPPAAAEGRPPLVNWDVVSDTWQNVQAGLRRTADDLEKTFRHHTG